MRGAVWRNTSPDSLRYSTPKKRRAEITRMFEYTIDNVCYSYSIGAIKNLVSPEVDTGDLDGVSASAGELITDSDDNDDGLLSSLTMRETGVYRRTEEGALKIWDLSLRKVGMIVDLDAKNGVIAGYEGDVYRKGEMIGRHLMDLKVFMSRHKLVEFSTRLQGVFIGDDKQTQAIHGLVRNIALKEKRITYLVHREGLDLVRRPEGETPQFDFIWVSRGKVVVFVKLCNLD
jgi:hypothetical protein